MAAHNFVDLTGKVFGRLTVLYRVLNKGNRQANWLCRCECGRETSVISYQLTASHTLSCGCSKRDRTIERNTIHGLSKLPEYGVWKLMRTRCNNANGKSWKDYGGRGIRICPEWDEFSVFYCDMGSRPSPQHQIDRKNNDGHYCKENCKWSTRAEQMRNYRRNVLVSYRGEVIVLKDLSDRFNVSVGVAYHFARTGRIGKIIPGASVVKEGNSVLWSIPLKKRTLPTQCKNGHAFDAQNTAIGRKVRPDAPCFRVCRECHRLREANRREKLKKQQSVAA